MAKPTAPDTAQVPTSTDHDSITVLYTEPGHFASKTIRRNPAGNIEIQNFDAGTFFGVLHLPPVDGIGMLSNYLTQLEAIPNALVIRGVPLPHVDTGLTVHRRKVNFLSPPGGHRWVMIDIDKHPLPKRLLSKRHSHAAIDYLVKKLPMEFHEASYHWAFSSSTGFKGSDTVSAHLWFYLKEPVTEAELTRWGEFVNAKAGRQLIDTALFRDVQPHFTAAPRFDGVADPLLTRSGLCEKRHDVVELQLPPSNAGATRKSNLAPPTSGIVHVTNQSDDAGFESRLSRIGDHPGGQGFYLPLLSAAASYVATYGAQGTDIEALFTILNNAAMAADRRHHTHEAVEHRASREQIMPMIQSAMSKYGHEVRSRSKSRLLSDIEPHFKANPITASEASRQIDALIRGTV